MLRLFGISDELVDGLFCEKLTGQNLTPASELETGTLDFNEVGRKRQVESESCKQHYVT